MSVAGVDLSTIPNLPGYGFKRKPKAIGKHKTFELVHGVRIMQEHYPEKAKMVAVDAAIDNRRRGLCGESTTQEAFAPPYELAQTQMPAWDVLDRHVLRFYGYFQENVPEANMENSRSRLLTIMYYLEDDTCHITEKKQDNSGMPQGQLIRRHRFPSANGGYVSWQDLRVGSELVVYGRVIALTDCDPYTRTYYVSVGMDQDGPYDAPLDSFALTQLSLKAEKPRGAPKSFESNYREAMLGGGHVNADMQQFMEWDRKVCRFFAVHDDVSSPLFERRPFVLLYFLADNTVEIREQYPANCGRDKFAIFFRRAKIPSGKVQVRSPMEKALAKKDMVQLSDFAVGATIELIGLPFFIYDADQFTREFYKQELGADLEECKDIRLPDRVVPKAPTPPYTGYGSWEDSLGSVYKLMPKPPRKDYQKLFENDKKILRFTAQIHQPKPQDSDRMFVVCWYLADDSMMIHEPPVRNLGIVTGKFLEKGVHVNELTGELFTLADLYPGSVIKVCSREFQIVEPDEYTRKFFRENGVFRDYDLTAVLEKLREGMRQQFPLVRDVFRRFDADHDGVLTYAEFKQALDKWHFTLRDEEVIILMKHFDARQDGQISYNEFCDVLLDQDYTSSMLTTKAPMSKEFDPDYAAKATLKAEERAETEKIRAVVRTIGDIVYRQNQTFARLCKEFAHVTFTHLVTCQQIREALNSLGNFFSLEDVVRCVRYVLPEADLDKVNYLDFLKAMVTSYHDVSGVR